MILGLKDSNSPRQANPLIPKIMVQTKKSRQSINPMNQGSDNL